MSLSATLRTELHKIATQFADQKGQPLETAQVNLADYLAFLDRQFYWQRMQNLAEARYAVDGNVKLEVELGAVGFDLSEEGKGITVKTSISRSGGNLVKLESIDPRQGIFIIGTAREGQEELDLYPAPAARRVSQAEEDRQLRLTDAPPEGAVLGGHMRYWFLDPEYKGDPVSQGRAAHFAGLPKDANPYAETDDRWAQWVGGFNGASGETPEAGRCVNCGCTEDSGCIDPRTGTTCGWANEARTLCTVCAAKAAGEIDPDTETVPGAQVAWYCDPEFDGEIVDAKNRPVPFLQGRAAWEHAEAPDVNPYQPDTEKRAQWEDGHAYSRQRYEKTTEGLAWYLSASYAENAQDAARMGAHAAFDGAALDENPWNGKRGKKNFKEAWAQSWTAATDQMNAAPAEAQDDSEADQWDESAGVEDLPEDPDDNPDESVMFDPDPDSDDEGPKGDPDDDLDDALAQAADLG